MGTPIFEFFLNVFSEFTFDPELVRFFEFVQEQLRHSEKSGYPGAVGPKACLLLCTSYGLRNAISPPEFKGLAKGLQSTHQSLDGLISEALEPVSTQNAAVMTREMVGVISAAREIAKQNRGTGNLTIAARDLIQALADYLQNSASNAERAFFDNLAINPSQALQGLHPAKSGPSTGLQAESTETRVSDQATTLTEEIGRLDANSRKKREAWDVQFATLRRGSGLMWSTTLDRVLDLLWEEHTLAFTKSVREPDQRGNVQLLLTPRGFFLAALLYGCRHVNELRGGAEDHRGQTLFRVYLATELKEDRIHELLKDEFFRPPSSTGATSQNQSVVSPELESVINRADAIRKSFGGDPYIGTRHLLLAFLEPPPNSKTGDLVIRDGDGLHLPGLVTAFRNSVIGKPWVQKYDTSADWPGEFERLEKTLPEEPSQKDSQLASNIESKAAESAIRIGGRTSFSRTAAGNEIVLGVNEYANVLAKLLKSSDDKDLCLAIFGPWGRGKTFLMERMIDRIQEAHEDANYEVVKFSAWKYPSRPEVWIHLYETFFCTLARIGWFRSLAFTVLAGICRHGVAKLWIAWFALMLTAMPKTWLLKGTIEYLGKFELAVAAAIVFFVVVFLLEFWTTTSHLRRLYLSGTRHFERLGLQGTVGGDLKALLKGWVQVDFESKKVRRGLRFFWAAAFSLIALIFWRSHGAPAVAISFSVIVVAVATVIGLAFRFSGLSPSRILLVVDDLDRCQFDHLLAVVESIKLLLEDADVSKRVQVIMLTEEDVLKHAIWEKYKSLTETNAQKAIGTTYDGNRIVRENLEKLFTAHLRLGPLKPSDVADIIFNFAGKSESSEQSKPPASATMIKSPLETEADATAVQETENKEEHAITQLRKPDRSTPRQTADITQKQPVRTPAPTHELDLDLTISLHEKQVIFAAINFTYGDKQSELGPRALRAIMFRYQLARLLLDELGEKRWSPALLARMIVQRHLDGSIDLAEGQDDVDVLKRVAEQIA